MNNLKVGTALRLYEIASHACRPLEFPRAVATDPADELLRKFEADQRRRLAELLSDLRALADPQAPEVEGYGDTEKPPKHFGIFRLTSKRFVGYAGRTRWARRRDADLPR